MRRLLSLGCCLAALTPGARALDVVLPEPALPPVPMTVVRELTITPAPKGVPVFALAYCMVDTVPAPRPPPSPTGLIDLFGGEHDLRELLTCRRVEVARIRAEVSFDREELAPAEIESARVAADDAAALLRVATRDATYHWSDEDEWRLPVFKFRLKFHGPEGTTLVDLSFDDRTLRVVRGERCVAMAHFDFGRDEFAAFIDHYFPGALRLDEDR